MKDNVYKKLKKEIIEGNIEPGDTLVERQIGQKYDISRTPVREILWKLNSEGLLEQNEGKSGYLVRKLTLEDIFEVFQGREAIEGMAARLACKKGDTKFIKSVKKLREKLEELDIEKNSYKGVEIGRKLHDSIIEAANNNYLTEFYDKLRNLTDYISNITKTSPYIETKSKDHHILIIKSIEKRDENNCEKHMREHLRTTCRLFTEYFYPDLFNNSK